MDLGYDDLHFQTIARHLATPAPGLFSPFLSPPPSKFVIIQLQYIIRKIFDVEAPKGGDTFLSHSLFFLKPTLGKRKNFDKRKLQTNNYLFLYSSLPSFPFPTSTQSEDQ